MSTLASAATGQFRPLRRFFRTPKGIVLVILLAIVVLAVPSEGAANALPGVLVAVTSAACLDLALTRLRKRHWAFPSGAVLSGLFVAMVLSPQEPLFVPFAASVVVVGSKRVFRLGPANVFNPAAFALVVTALLFGSGHSWWGALPELDLAGVVVVMACGILVADRLNKLPVVLAFLGSYFLLFSASSLIGDPAKYADIFRAPDLHAALFFAFFMLDDPPTCPVRYRGQVQFALITTAASYLIFVMLGAVYFLPAGLLVGNLHEAGRKQISARRRRRRARGA